MKLIKARMRNIWPDPKNPRRDFGDVEALAATFGLNPERPGEPVNPIVVVPHGHGKAGGEPIYMIVDGERRYRAMRTLRGDEGEVTCILCENMDEANAMVSMLATDDKAALTEEERSRGVQQMLLLDVPFEKVERAARLGKGQAAKVKLGAALAADRARQMTLAQLEAMCEFEGDPDALGELRDAGEGWERVADRLRAKRKSDAERAALEAACAAAGVELAEGRPDGAAFAWEAEVGEPDGVADAAAGMPEGFVACLRDKWQGWRVELYAPREEPAPDPEEEARRERERELLSAISAAEEAQRAWYASRAADPASTPATDALLLARMFDPDGDYTTGRNRERALDALGLPEGDAEPEGSMSGWVAALAWADRAASVGNVADRLADMGASGYAERRCGLWAEQLDAMVADGYEAGEADMAVSDAVAAYLDARAQVSEGGGE